MAKVDFLSTPPGAGKGGLSSPYPLTSGACENGVVNNSASTACGKGGKVSTPPGVGKGGFLHLLHWLQRKPAALLNRGLTFLAGRVLR